MTPLNPFFRQEVASEQRLVQDLVNEHLRMYGQEVYYMPRKYMGTDSIMRENILARFDDAYPIEAYVANVDGFQGSGDLMSKFGIRVTDEATFIISKERFEDYISEIMSNIDASQNARRADSTEPFPTRPMEGDLVYFPLTDSLFEIKFVEHESPFYQLGSLYTFELRCELFEYQQEVIDTSIDDIDDNVSDVGYVVTLTLAGTGVTATAVGGARNGAVNEIVLLNDGYGYSSVPTVAISTSPNGLAVANATAVAIGTIGAGSTTYSVQSIRIVNPGFGYTEAPTVTIVGDGSGTRARANIGTSGVFYVSSLSGGAEYSGAPNVAITTSPVGLSSANATAEAVVSAAGTVSQIRIINAGFGYTGNPVISIDAPTKRRNAILQVGIVTYMSESTSLGSTLVGLGTTTINDSQVAITTTITSPVLTGVVTSISITDPGFGYSTAPTITISAPTAFAQGLATAVIGLGTTGGAGIGSTVRYLETTYSGFGYAEAPTVTIANPSGFTASVITVGLTTVGIGTTTFANISLVAISTQTGSITTSPSSVISGLTTSVLAIGDYVTSDSGVSAGTTITSFINSFGTTFVSLSQNITTGVGTSTFTFSRETITGYGNTVYDLVGIGTTVGSISIGNSGNFYASAPTLSITGPSTTLGTGSTATATAFINSSGIVTGAIITSPGFGYSTTDTLTVTVSGGIGTALATASINAAGIITALTVTNSGFGYTTVPTVSIVGRASTATANALINSSGIVTGVVITNSGLAYPTRPSVTVSEPENPVNAGDFDYNEIVTGQTGLATALVKSWNSNTKTLQIYSVAGDFGVGELLAGSATTVTTGSLNWTTGAYYIENVSYEDTDPSGVDAYESNTEFQDAADDIVDWTETNPFGTF